MAIASLLQLALAASASAAMIPRELAPGFASYPLIQAERRGPLARRDVETPLYNHSVITYLFEIDVGTPPQKVQVVLDTGSFELWVDPTCSTASTQDQVQSCGQAGTYDPSQSSTVVDQQATAKLPYGKGEVAIAYVTDSVLVPGQGNTKTMSKVVLGVGQQSTDLAFGIAGIGHGQGFNLQFPNLIDEMFNQGVTQSKAFSVALGSKDSSNGGIVVFGGVDTKKFTGSLTKFDNLPAQVEGTNGEMGPYRYWIQLASLGVTKPGSSSTSTYASSSFPIVLDTGSTLTYLPQAMVDALASDFNAQVLSSGQLQVACSLASQAGTVDFNFGAATIKVPYHDIIWEIGTDACVLGVQPSGKTVPLLGDTFLRSAYAVFDQTNNNIYLGQARDCGSHEQPLPAAPGAAATFKGECDASAPSNGGSGSGSKQNAAGRSAGGLWVAAALVLGVQAIFFAL